MSHEEMERWDPAAWSRFVSACLQTESAKVIAIQFNIPEDVATGALAIIRESHIGFCEKMGLSLSVIFKFRNCSSRSDIDDVSVDDYTMAIESLSTLFMAKSPPVDEAVSAKMTCREVCSIARLAKMAKRIRKERRRMKDVIKLARWRQQKLLESLSSDEPDHEFDTTLTSLTDHKFVHHSDEDGSENHLADDICQLTLSEIMIRNKSGQRNSPFTDNTKKIAFVLWCHGNRAYNLLHSFFGFPATQTLFDYSKANIDDTMNRLTTMEHCTASISEFRRRYDLVDEIDANLGVDAFSIVPFETSKGVTHNSCFLFVLLPWKYAEKPCLLRIESFSHGSAGPEIQKIIDELVITCESCGVVIHFVASDGDQGYSTRHRKFFEKWFPYFMEQGFDATIKWVAGQRKVPVLDFLHLAKNA